MTGGGRPALVGAALLFSTGGAAIKACQLSGWQVASLRSGVAAVALVALVPAARRGWSWRAVPIAVAYALTLTLFVLANKLTTSANAIFLQSSAPLWLALLAPLVLQEPVRSRDLPFMGAVGAGLGLFVIDAQAATATATDPRLGDAVAVGSGICWALTLLGLRRLATAQGAGAPPPIAAVAMGNVGAFALGLPLALPVTGATGTDWAVLLYLGVAQIGLAYLLLTRGLAAVPALEASLLLLLEPVVNPLWAWLVHGEQPGRWAVLGGATILAATTARALDGRRRVPG